VNPKKKWLLRSIKYVVLLACTVYMVAGIHKTMVEADIESAEASEVTQEVKTSVHTTAYPNITYSSEPFREVVTEEIEETIPPTPTPDPIELRIETVKEESEISDLYVEYAFEIGGEYDVSPELIVAIIERESDGDPNTTGLVGEAGLMQVTPKWHYETMEKLGVTDLYDPYSNILVATDTLRELFDTYDTIYEVLMYYNGGYYGLEQARLGNYSEYAEWVENRSCELQRAEESK